VRRILVAGATSAIAEATCRRFAAQGDGLFLLARNGAKLEAVAADLRLRGAAHVGTLALDMLQYDRHAEAIERAVDALGGLDVALVAYGSLPVQRACEASAERTRREIEVNFTSVASFLTLLAGRFEASGAGTLAAISSVAGDRGRASNYTYGAAKAGLDAFLSGLRNRLHAHGVHVLTIKPGFVDTPMTAQLRKNALWATPDDIARGIVRAIERRRAVVYLPPFWRPIMLVVRAIPEALFVRLKL